MKSSIAARGILSGVALMAAAAMFFVVFGAVNASALSPQVTYSGNATFTVGTGKAGKALRGKVAAIAPAKAKRQGKKTHVNAPVKTFRGNVTLKGGIRFKAGKRKVGITALSVKVGQKRTVVKGKLGKKTITAFNVAGRSVTSGDTANGSVRITTAKLSLSKAAAKGIKKALKLKKLPAGQVGTFSLMAKVTTTAPVDPCVADPNAEGCTPVDPCVANPDAPGCKPDPVVDPYLAQCDVAATSKVQGNLPGAAPLPTLASPVTGTGPANLTWGFKSSFRSYLVFGAQGSMHGLNGATVNPGTPFPTGFNFPIAGSTYSSNGTEDLSDDQAIVNATGDSVFCATGHDFRVVISNPTVVVDGDDSRIVADVDTNLTGVWTEKQRIDLAELDLTPAVQKDAVSPATGSSVTWADVPATLTAAGADAICGTGEQAACTYEEGTELDPITVSVDIPSQVGNDTYFAQCGVGANEKTSGNKPGASPLPVFEDSLDVVAGNPINWGFRTAFRGYVYGSNTAPGSPTPLNALDGASRVPGGDPTRGFSFPATGGVYTANDPADTSDDQAVINGSGTSLFCNNAHGFWAAISNPTIVIDGADSRIVADIASNETGKWVTKQRVDLADLDISNNEPIYNYSGSRVDWGSVPATLSADAAPFATYSAGTPLDAINVSLQTPYDNSDLNALATYVSTELPFPLPDATQGGCTLGAAVDANGQTIDSAQAAPAAATNPIWKSNPARPAALPTLTGATALTGGGLDWGFRSSLRGSLNSTGEFNLAGGTTANATYFGNGPGGTPRTAPAPGAMSGAGKFFTWPAASTAIGSYAANGAGTADDQAIVNLGGTVAFCQTQSAQLYGTIFSNPTVVIDGANSRITMDVATRYRLSWVRARVDFATLDLTDPGLAVNSTDNAGTTTVSWTLPDAVSNVGPVKLTAAGESMVNMLSRSAYVAGLGLDGVTIRASYPTPGL